MNAIATMLLMFVYFFLPLTIVAGIGELVMWYIDYRREKYGRFVGVSFRRNW